ncbi:MAG: hypothetical protein ACREBU_00260 [Nitrososphaera sp.]
MSKKIFNLSDADFLQAVTEEFLDPAVSIYFSRFRDCYISNSAFVDGDQWDEEDIEELTKEQKAYVVFNRVGINVDVLTGFSLINPQDIFPIPIDVGDIVIDEILEGAIRFIRHKGNAYDEEANLLNDLFIGGVGVLSVYVDYSTGEPRILFDRVNPLEMTWDSSADKQNLQNAGWICRERLYAPSVVDYLWEGAIEKYGLTEVNYSLYGNYVPSSNFTNLFNSGVYGSTTGASHDSDYVSSGIPIKEYQWFEYGDFYKVSNPVTGQVIEISVTRYDKVQKELELGGYPKVKFSKKIYYKCFISGNHLLERSENTSSKGFTYLFATGKRKVKTGIWYGLVDNLRDPQKWANKFFSSILDIIAANSKGGAFVEQGAFADVRQAEKDWAKSSPLIKLKRGGVSRIRERVPHPYPSGIERMMTFAIEAIREVSGINVEVLGLADRRQANSLEETRKQSALAIVARFFSSMKLLRQSEGYLIIDLMRNYLLPDQLIKIDSANVNRFDTIQSIFENDIDYEILVDEAPLSGSYKDKAWQGMTQVLPILLRTGVPIPPEIADYAPIPATLAQKWKQLIIQSQQVAQVQQALGQQAGQSQVQPQPGQGRDINNLITANQSVNQSEEQL